MKYSVKDFTLEEKLMLLTGKDSWQTHDLGGKLPSIFLADGPSGLRKIKIKSVSTNDNGIITSKETRLATAMPTLSVVANSWNTDLAYLDGQTIADECLEADVDVLLAPGVNIKRNALNGRNFEYFSEDPFHTGKMARAYIDGVQSKGVGTSLKHYCCNNSEHDRNSTSTEVDERTLREIYLPAFEEAVKSKPWTVMCSYNPINGIYASAHKKLLKNVLRDEFGFDGLIVSDWGAVHDHAAAVKATLDLRMPYNANAYSELKSAYDSGKLTEAEIDFCVNNLLELIEKGTAPKQKHAMTTADRHDNAIKIAKEGIVLLKNEDGILPLKKGIKLAVLGQYNEKPPIGGGGSSSVKTEYVQTKLSDLLAEKLGCETVYHKINYLDIDRRVHYLKAGYKDVYSADAVILCVGEQAPIVSEGHDRESMRLSAVQENMIINASKYNENVVVLVYGGSAIDMSAWIDKVKAVVFVGFAGEGVNQALSSILTGETVPSGKLAETFPLCIENTVTRGEFDDGKVDWYKEGVFVGYRYYDKYNEQVLFPFGHGLSYAKFEYSNLKIEKNGATDFTVSYDITNVSDVDGKEVSQVYVKEVFSSVIRPEKELKGFSKDLIKAGETKKVKIKLDFRSFAYYSTALDAWTVENGPFEIYVGASSRDIRMSAKLNVERQD